MTGKSADAFRTISEVADWLDRPAHVLRFWESKFTQVKPVKRAGGRRYYRPEDMRLLGGIKKLLHDDGMTIKGAQKVLREQGVRYVSALSQPLDEDGTLTGVAMPVRSEVANVDTAPEQAFAKAEPPKAIEPAAPSVQTPPEMPPEPEAEPEHTAEQPSQPAATPAPAPSMPSAADEEDAARVPHMPAQDAAADSANDTAPLSDEAPQHAAPVAPPHAAPPPPAAPAAPSAGTAPPDSPPLPPEADAPAPRPLGADLPPPPDVSALRGAPGLLSQIAALKHPVAKANHAEITALLDRLAALRDRMASARKG